MNPREQSSTENQNGALAQGTRKQLLGMFMTAACGAGFTVTLWIILAMIIESRSRGYENIAWSGTLWLSAMLCTGIVAYSTHSVRPVLSCTIVFGIFGLTYMACEGPIFGVVSEGGDPSTTQFVVWNLACLPMGVLVATEIGRWLGHRHRVKSIDEQTIGREALDQPFDLR